MDVSIILVNFNGGQTILNCLGSVFRHTSGLSYDVLVVDNGSTDGSPERIQADFPLVRLIRSPANVGYSRACNQALQACMGEMILRMDSDTVIHDNAVKATADFLRGHPEAGIAGCRLVFEDGSYQKSTGRARSILNEFKEKWVRDQLERGSRIITRREKAFAGSVRSVGWVCGAFMMIRRAVIDEIGLLDEAMFLYFEDIDWCTRARKAGWKVLFAPHIRVTHLGGSSGSKDPWKNLLEYRRSQVLYYKRHYGAGPDTQVLRLFLVAKALRGFASTAYPTVVGTVEQRVEQARRRRLCLDLLRLAIKG